MNKDAEKTARKETGAAPAIVDLRDRVPQMSDDALATLAKNAARLQAQGTTAQKGAAADLLPVVEAELARRAAEKRANAPQKPARTVKTRAKPKATVTEGD